jgi:hypothetical protein
VPIKTASLSAAQAEGKMPASNQYEIEIEIPVSKLALMTDKERPKEFQISYKTTRHFFSTDASDVAVYVLTFARDVAVGVIATRLYELIKKHSAGKSEKMTIDRKTILIDEGQIKKVIEEHITHEKK